MFRLSFFAIPVVLRETAAVTCSRVDIVGHVAPVQLFSRSVAYATFAKVARQEWIVIAVKHTAL